MEVRMHSRYYLYLATFFVLLSACGQPDVSTQVVPTPAKQSGSRNIAGLLGAPPALGQTVEIDAYHWVGYRRGVSFARDAQGCPLPSDVTILSDWPVPEAIRFPFGGYANVSPDYPPDAEPWLIPMPVLIASSPGTAVAAVGTDTSLSTALPEVAGSLQIPYHARLRGHIGDPAFAKCAHSDRIFVVENIAAVYQEFLPQEPMLPLYQPPENYKSWPRYHDASLGYSFAYAPDWTVEPLREPDVLSAVAVRTTQAPDNPIIMRVHAGETHTDPYDASSLPDRIKRRNRADDSGFFAQDQIQVVGGSNGQHLQGFWVERVLDPSVHTMTVLISAHGRTYEITVRYSIGLRADQSLLDTYALVLDRFHLDAPPEPSPTPPIKQAVGQGPFLSQDEAVAAMRRKHGDVFDLLEAKLVSEAEMRQNGGQSTCSSFFGHPDGVWMLRVRAEIDGARRVLLWGLDATTGDKLCGYELSLETPIPGTAQPVETVPPAYPEPAAP
jgi:hypothetical protein